MAIDIDYYDRIGPYGLPGQECWSESSRGILLDAWRIL